MFEVSRDVAVLLNSIDSWAVPDTVKPVTVSVNVGISVLKICLMVVVASSDFVLDKLSVMCSVTVSDTVAPLVVVGERVSPETVTVSDCESETCCVWDDVEVTVKDVPERVGEGARAIVEENTGDSLGVASTVDECEKVADRERLTCGEKVIVPLWDILEECRVVALGESLLLELELFPYEAERVALTDSVWDRVFVRLLLREFSNDPE